MAWDSFKTASCSLNYVPKFAADGSVLGTMTLLWSLKLVPTFAVPSKSFN